MGLGFRAGARVRDGARGKGGGGSAAPSCRRVAAISGVHESRLTERTWTRGVNEGTCRQPAPCPSLQPCGPRLGGVGAQEEEGGGVKRGRDVPGLTLEMCVPSERWTPEQPMHTSAPKGSTAQSGGAASSPQSAQQRLACAS